MALNVDGAPLLLTAPLLRRDLLIARARELHGRAPVPYEPRAAWESVPLLDLAVITGRLLSTPSVVAAPRRPTVPSVIKRRTHNRTFQPEWFNEEAFRELFALLPAADVVAGLAAFVVEVEAEVRTRLPMLYRYRSLRDLRVAALEFA